MLFADTCVGREEEIVALLTRTFAASDGPEEGVLIGTLADNLLRRTDSKDLFAFAAHGDCGAVVGAALFSRLTYARDDRTVLVLGPVAVETNAQGKGIGRALIAHGLRALARAGVDVAVTYGDPAYYTQLGFAPMDQAIVPAPFALSRPEGWLGLCLAGEAGDKRSTRVWAPA
jgi:putative acetyltransferase